MEKLTKDDFLRYEKLENEISFLREKLITRIKEIHNIYYEMYTRNNICIDHLSFDMYICDVYIINSEYISYTLKSSCPSEFPDIERTRIRRIPISIIDSDNETVKKYFEELLKKELDEIKRKKEEEENNKRDKKFEMYKKLKKEFEGR